MMRVYNNKPCSAPADSFAGNTYGLMLRHQAGTYLNIMNKDLNLSYVQYDEDLTHDIQFRGRKYSEIDNINSPWALACETTRFGCDLA